MQIEIENKTRCRERSGKKIANENMINERMLNNFIDKMKKMCYYGININNFSLFPNKHSNGEKNVIIDQR